MSDYGDYGVDDLLDLLDDDYEYIDEATCIADELAEQAVPSPPPYDGEEAYYDDDYYGYNMDWEDGTLGYFDYPGRKRKRAGSTGDAKRNTGSKVSPAKKRRITQEGGVAERDVSPTPTVLWRTQDSRNGPLDPEMNVESQEAVSLLKNWRDLPAVSLHKLNPPGNTSPKLPDVAAEEDVPPLSPSSNETSEPPQIDEDAVKAVLAARLGNMGDGIQGLDQNMLLQLAMRMLGGEEDADDIAGELADDLLDRDEDDPSAVGIAAWLDKQKGADTSKEKGTSGTDGEAEEAVVGNNARALDDTATRSTTDKNAQAIDADTVVSEHNISNPAASQLTNPRKRKGVTEPIATEVPGAKRTQRSFDAPTAASRARHAAPPAATRTRSKASAAANTKAKK